MEWIWVSCVSDGQLDKVMRGNHQSVKLGSQMLGTLVKNELFTLKEGGFVSILLQQSYTHSAEFIHRVHQRLFH